MNNSAYDTGNYADRDGQWLTPPLEKAVQKGLVYNFIQE